MEGRVIGHPVLVINTIINAITLRMLNVKWRESLYVGAILSQIGEFSFVLAAVGKQSGIIEDYAYQMRVIIIALSLLVILPGLLFFGIF